jgi:molecular chaperone DnaK (HSP70)
VYDCLKKAQVIPQEIDVVLKVGRSSNNLFVDEMLQRIFSGHIRGIDVFTSVASGLAVAAENLFD